MPPHYTPSRHRGVTMIYAIIMMIALVGFCSFAVDMGRVEVVKLELRRTADAAARAAASAIASGVTATQNAAVAMGTANTADGSSVTIDPTNDVEFGTYTSSSKTFSVLSGSNRANANAIRITCRRTAARGTAIPMLFAKIVGKSSADVSASCIATATTTAPSSSSTIAFVGLSTFTTSGVTTDSYNASSGSYAAVSHGSLGSLCSNSDLTLWSDVINGDAHPGKGHSIQGGSITGSTTPLTSTLSYNASNTPHNSNNSNITPLMTSSTGTFSSNTLNLWGAITLPGGTYVFQDFNVYAPITFTGAATLYIAGQCNISGSGCLYTYQNKPANLTICCSGSLNLWPGQPLYADLFSPTAILNTSGGSLYGQFMVDQAYVYNISLHYDTSLPDHSPHGGPSGSGSGGGSSSGSTVISIAG